MILGARQQEMLRIAGLSRKGFVRPYTFLNRRACRRLQRRGLLVPAVGFPDTWRIPRDNPAE